MLRFGMRRRRVSSHRPQLQHRDEADRRGEDPRQDEDLEDLV